MSTDELVALCNVLGDIVHSAEDCLQKNRIVPCLVLIYAGIDAVSALESGAATREDFKRWVSQYLLTPSWQPCTSADLYGARCGLLHTFSANSDLSRAKKIHPVWYAWKDHKAEDLKLLADAVAANVRVVHLDTLLEHCKDGLFAYFKEINTDSDLQKKVRKSATQLLSNWRPP